jgi:hypothetical protein
MTNIIGFSFIIFVTWMILPEIMEQIPTMVNDNNLFTITEIKTETPEYYYNETSITINHKPQSPEEEFQQRIDEYYKTR